MNNPPEQEYPRIRWMFFCIVFYALPILLICFAYGKIFQEREKREKQEIEDILERVLISLSNTSDTRDPTIGFLQPILKSLSRKILESHISPERAKPYLQELDKLFPGLFEFTILDGNGNAISELSPTQVPRSLLKKFFFDLDPYIKGDQEQLTANWPLYSNFLGPLQLPVRLTHSKINLAFSGERHAFVYFSPPTKNGMVIVRLNRLPNWDLLPIIYRLKKFASYKISGKVGVFLIENGKPPPLMKLSAHVENLDSILAQLETSPNGALHFPDLSWYQTQVSPTHRLVAVASPRRNLLLDARERLILVGILLSLFGICSIFTWKIICW
ncbi:MAG: hypothetical protein HQM09_02875 [Candidatus Riflebacteria bacterium]|nr:hypothetical protein [Candidatus Riflebacteria bacterium]